ncbi:MAG: hypothetical protein V5A16_04755, partial [Haloplanus sp.]
LLLTALIPVAIWAISYPRVAAVAVTGVVALGGLVYALGAHVASRSVTRRVATVGVGWLGRS